MLVLSRKKDESFTIKPKGDKPVTLNPGEEIVIQMVEIHGSGKARVGIEAPKDFAIFRNEVIEKIQREEAEAAAKAAANQPHSI